MSLNPIDLERKDTENGRRYLCPNGEWVPSVTTVIGYGKDFSAWEERIGKEEADRIRDESAAAGTLAHDNIEGIIDAWKQGVDDDSCYGSPWCNPENDVFMPAIEKCLQGYRSNSVHLYSEMRIWHLLGFAGTFDLFRGYRVVGDGLTWILHDFKTKLDPAMLVKLKTEAYREKALSGYWEQAAAYAAGIAHCYGILIEGACIELLFPEGKYLSYGKNKQGLLGYWDSFKSKLAIYRKEVMDAQG